MNDPLEIMAKAAWELYGGSTWEEISVADPEKRRQTVEFVRAALLALAEAELPEEVSKTGRETLLAYGNGSDDMFRAMLRSIANGKTE